MVTKIRIPSAAKAKKYFQDKMSFTKICQDAPLGRAGRNGSS